MSNRALLLATALAFSLAPFASADVVHPGWARNATIYEVNVRQYSPDSALSAVTKDLPRLKTMGIDIVWLMPIHPIGKEHRKGPLGSYYSVADYKAVNPEFGTMDDLKTLVARAHGLGMKVILDWVPNHTAWDNPWVKDHPEWYLKDETGKIGPVTFGSGADKQVWEDVVGLDYKVPALRAAMIDAMAFWIKTADVDGFREDVATNVPVDFWNEARRELDKIKPVFMLAESDKPELQQDAFDMTYGWDFYHVLVKSAKTGDADVLRDFFAHPPKTYPAGSYRMEFTSDHDENSWAGSDTELYGKAFKPYAVIAATVPGMPLVYSGQESGLDKRLKFFEKDPIAWKNYPLADFYRGLLTLKHDTPALWNDNAAMDVLDPHNAHVFAFRRAKDGHSVTVTVNLSDKVQVVKGAGLKPGALKPYAWTISLKEASTRKSAR
ncbi:alpha-amylase family glycosyl hydrolase [Rhizomicrobium electricum]|uniref:Alpha-amylase family glycosyl hydrolase n=1 Tax=Rhizomicrobium electricum TaxID=480070 RepID=A0ABN1EGL9_9PROT|nr:alpha-amylase family glycosyl hydrolase [Rhizomicrobium electricum]NIJ48514.1 glycosidase [Rhizomicrobium electricum]